MKKFSFVIVAGGSGSRMSADGVKKQFREIGGLPMWMWSARLAASMAEDGICETILVLPRDDIDNVKADIPSLKITHGGSSRPESVMNGLNACSCDYVMVHDAARPFACTELLRRLMRETTETVGAIPVMPASEAIKRVTDESSYQLVESVDRDGLFMTQTPQSFHRRSLIAAMKQHGANAKDEAEAWLAAGYELRCVEGERMNFKVTWQDDMKIAEALAGNMETRTGLGFDVHQLVPDRALILGGAKIDSQLGLLGHSDADALAHAVADAVLGAAGLPDIGNLFPASDNAYLNADSMKLLERAVDMVRKEGWEITWADAVIRAQVPKLNKHIPEMRERLSKILNPGMKCCVNIKAKSAEHVGDFGGAADITCWVSATLRRSAV